MSRKISFSLKMKQTHKIIKKNIEYGTYSINKFFGFFVILKAIEQEFKNLPFSYLNVAIACARGHGQ
jgi:hypothetical protein